MKHCITWLDNCTVHNKDWCLFSSMVLLINMWCHNGREHYTRYFKPSHTFLSVDSFHHGVQFEMKKATWRKCVCNSRNQRKEDCGSDDQRWCSLMQKQLIITSASKALCEHHSAEHDCRPVPKGSHMLCVKTSRVDEFSDIQFLKNFKLAMPVPLRKEARCLLAWQKGNHCWKPFFLWCQWNLAENTDASETV